MTLLNDKWEVFRKQVIAPDASFYQVQDMKTAFFGGMLDLFIIITRDITKLPDEIAEHNLQRIENEIIDTCTEQQTILESRRINKKGD